MINDVFANALHQTDIQVAHPDIVFYDFYGAWDKPIVSDTEQYLGARMSAFFHI